MNGMPFADRLTRHHYRLEAWRSSDEEAQRYAEREGHVPPGLGPVDVKRWNFARDFVWHWITGEDSTGQLKELWLVDGPWALRTRMIEADTPKGARVHFLAFDWFTGTDPDDTSRVWYTYKVDRRADGLWFGRWIR